MRTFKLTVAQKLKLLELGYSKKEIELMVKADIPKAKTLKICFSETEVSEWLNKRHPPILSVDELFNWWVLNAKSEYTHISKSGLYKAYEDHRAMGKPLVLYKEMSADNKPHKVY
jgi:predicted DNA-binding transcriptional regulator AlpA